VFPERLRPLVDVTADLSDRFRSAGHTLYLVGGSVRDAIVADGDVPAAEPGSDLDFTTDARPDDIESVLRGWADAVWTQGKRFGTIACLRGDQKYEITTHRAEAYHPDSRKPDVAFGDPEVSFADDPLRMLRAARFMARLDLEPTDELVAAVRSGHRRLDIVSAERIRDELDKIMLVPVPSVALWFIVRTGLAEEFLPELPGLALEQDPIHRHKDVLGHTLAVVDKTSPDRLLRLAALFHDVGKPRTRAFADGGVTFHHHEVVGARMTRKRMQALRYPNDEIDLVAELVNLHLRFHTYRLGWTDRAVRRYVRDAGPLLDRLNELTRCDCTTRNAAKARALDRRMDELESRIAQLREQEELDAIRPDLDGAQVMDHLGIPPGRAVGDALGFLLELRMDEGPLGEEEALRRLDVWWEARGASA